MEVAPVERITRTLRITVDGETVTLIEDVVPLDPERGIVPMPRIDGPAGVTMAVQYEVRWIEPPRA